MDIVFVVTVFDSTEPPEMDERLISVFATMGAALQEIAHMAEYNRKYMSWDYFSIMEMGLNASFFGGVNEDLPKTFYAPNGQLITHPQDSEPASYTENDTVFYWDRRKCVWSTEMPTTSNGGAV
jgi:hypothetical protein